MYAGLTANGVVMPTMTRHPANTPAHPTPAIALPTIKTSELGATPHTRLPSSKRDSAVINDQRTSKCANTRPYVGWKAHAVSRYWKNSQRRKNEPHRGSELAADPYQPASSGDLNSLVMCGIALATIVRSSATRKAARLMPTISEKRANGEGWMTSTSLSEDPLGASAALSLSSFVLVNSEFSAAMIESGGF